MLNAAIPHAPLAVLVAIVVALAGTGRVPLHPEPDIAALRAQGPAALAALLARWDAMAPGAERDALADTIDRVAAQRYATVSRLYWYTDLPSATAAATARHVPILELRLLGRLDDELSCANSRLFRETLYANTALSAFLRDHFVLYWSTERPVPRVTIDFGDGREIRTTVTGNSAHFIRDERGEIVDVLPGVYAPGPFRDELDKTLAFIATLDPNSVTIRLDQVRAYHADRAYRASSSWVAMREKQNLALLRLLKDPPSESEVARAQQRTFSKAFVEVPLLRGYFPDPGQLAPDETAAWARVAELHWGTAPVLDRASTTLVLALHNAGPIKSSTAALEKLIPRFEQHLLADSGYDELVLRAKVDAYFAQGKPRDFAALDRFLYADVFGTPRADAWLGLLPRTDVTGLPGDGAIVP